jgi:signal transduction histidine kinase
MQEKLQKLPHQLFNYLLSLGVAANITVLVISLSNDNIVLSIYTIIIIIFAILSFVFSRFNFLKIAVHIMLISYFSVFLHASFSSIGFLPLVLVFPIIIGLSFVFFENFYVKLSYSILCTIAALISSSLQLQFYDIANTFVLLSSGAICLFMMIAFSTLNLLQSKYFLEYRIALEENEKELQLQKQELEKYIKSNIQLEQFAHIAAHDLKSPLRNISNFIGLLKIKFADKISDQERNILTF